MVEPRKLFERQGVWQKQRAAHTWSEKIRMAETVRESAAQLAKWRPRRRPKPESCKPWTDGSKQ